VEAVATSLDWHLLPLALGAFLFCPGALGWSGLLLPAVFLFFA